MGDGWKGVGFEREGVWVRATQNLVQMISTKQRSTLPKREATLYKLSHKLDGAFARSSRNAKSRDVCLHIF